MTDHEGSAGPTAGSSPDDNVDVSTPAVVTWDSANCLSDVTFDLRHASSSNDAFFKLRTTLVLKASAPSKTALFLHIHPERVTSLILGIPADVDKNGMAAHQVEARRRLGTELICLQFALAQSPDLIGPKLPSLVPKNRASGEILDSLRSLACQRHFSIYLPQKAVLQSRLVLLCQLASIGVLKTNSRQADLSSLYRGQGAEVINIPNSSPSAAAAAPTAPREIVPPPSYNDLDPRPPPAPLEAPRNVTTKKRRRSSSSDDVATPHLDFAAVESMFRKIVDEQKAEMLQMIGEQQNKLYDRLLGDLKPYISQELNNLEAKIMDQVGQNSGKQVEEQACLVEKQLEDLKDDMEDTIDSRIHDVDERVEDEFYGLRLRLEDFIKEELGEAEQRIVDHLESAAHISFS